MPQDKRLRPIWKPAGDAPRLSAVTRAATHAPTRSSAAVRGKFRGIVHGPYGNAGGLAAGVLVHICERTGLALQVLFADRSFGEVERNGPIDVGAGEADGAALVFGDGLYQLEDVHRVTGAQRSGASGYAALPHVLGAAGLGRYAVDGDHLLDDQVENLVADVFHQHLGLDAAQEGLVGQVGRVQVGGEDHHQFERNLKFHARRQREVVDAAVQRNDPTVEQ